jgi:hypothetical protein
VKAQQKSLLRWAFLGPAQQTPNRQSAASAATFDRIGQGGFCYGIQGVKIKAQQAQQSAAFKESPSAARAACV